MVPLHKITGRLGNLMFDFAFIMAYAREHGLTDGYFPQDIKYFEKYQDIIKETYRAGNNYGRIDRVAIHVRRTDYLDQWRTQYVLPLSYYEQAMAQFPGEKFRVFSDDIEWCQRQEIFKNCEFSHSDDEIEDMNMMSACKHNIIANSTFSWWAAFINPHGGRVIMPRKWEKNDRVMSAPANWERI